MLTVEDYELIRRKFFLDGMSQRAIAAELGHSRKTVAKAIAHAAPPGYRLDRDEDPHLRRELDHDVRFQKLRLNAARSGVVMPWRESRIFAPAPSSHSTVHAQGPTKEGPANSRNAPAVLLSADSASAAACCSSRSLRQ
jgi:hypothetical protein